MNNRALTALLLGLPLLSTPASAQTVAEMLTVTAISSTLDAATTLRLPMPGGLVKNPAYAAKLAPSLLGADAGKYTELNLVITSGMAARLADTYLNNLKTEFAVAGFFQKGADRAYKVGSEIWTRSDFVGETGRTRVILVSKGVGTVKLLTAVSK